MNRLNRSNVQNPNYPAQPFEPPSRVIDSDPNTHVRKLRPWQAPLYAAGGLFFVSIIASVGLVGSDVVPMDEALWALYASVVVAAIPILIFAGIMILRMVVDSKHDISATRWAENRFKEDLDGDGLIGDEAASDKLNPADGTFEFALRYWVRGGKTTQKSSCPILGIAPDQWQRFRDRAISLSVEGEPPVAFSINTQGGGKGFAISKRWMNNWDAVARNVL